ncbi:MAG: ATP-dependent DNA helicase RecG [Oscillospiraceae bacterium]|nr:ATP-dependent DNA helicase RecG [Oscillospiraceae bacterium]
MANSLENSYLSQNIRRLKGVGQKRAAMYEKMKIFTFEDLLRHYPRGYLDYSETDDLSEQSYLDYVTVKAVVDRKTPTVRTQGGRKISRVYASTESGTDIELVYFNNPFVTQKLNVGEEYYFYGRLQGDLFRKQMTNPVLVQEEELEGMVPQYPLTEGLSSRMISANVRTILSDPLCRIDEFIPKMILDRYGLMDRDTAIRQIHFPDDESRMTEAKRRLVFEELFTLSVGMKLRRERKRTQSNNAFSFTDTDAFCDSLPFRMTDAQKRSLKEIASDLSKNEPMARLLQGDVGSGKTAVAAGAVYLAAKNGFQSAVMAPTEVLATQHAETFRKMLEPFDMTVGLLTSSVKGKQRSELLKQIANGNADLIVGTHALISEDVKYHRLGFVVTDEQHRFGVDQRAALSRKGDLPHTLVMSATPIPRTLSLIMYGDLDISILDEMPAGRRPVKTILVNDTYRERYLGFVRKTVEEGQQVYIVCPLVEDSEALGEAAVSATQYYEKISNEQLKGIPIALLHGKQTSEEKTRIMNDFQEGKIKVLVSTTVIEVGVDCPNATVMIVENAERFGLSTLHQLRGRVGRGHLQSWCVLVSSKDSGTAGERLKLLTETDDGFVIANEDLRMRGPGDFIGNRQHGLPNLTVAHIADDERILYSANEAAESLVQESPDLGMYPLMKNKVEQLFDNAELTMN